MTPEQIAESAKLIRRPDESPAQASVRAALYLRLHELTPQWTIPDVGFDPAAEKRSAPFPITDEELQRGWTSALGSFTLPEVPLTYFGDPSIAELLEEIEREDDPHDHRRRPGEVPQPKRTPPMWAHNPTQTRRDRKATRRVK